MLLSLTISALVIGSVYGLIALGYSLIYSASGLMTFCQGEILMFGAFVGLSFYRYLNWPFGLALLAAMLIMFLIGMLIERLLIRPILSKQAPGHLCGAGYHCSGHRTDQLRPADLGHHGRSVPCHFRCGCH